MDRSKTITAIFSAYCHLAVETDPTDGGSVTLDPSQPAEGYLPGTTVTLAADAEEGYEFDHWEGDLTGSDNPASIEMDGNKTITAIFSAYYRLAVETDPTDGGTVTPEPSQPAEGYMAGTEVTVTAIAEDGYRFDHWSGALSGSENPTTVTMVSCREVTANFTKPIPWWGIVAGVAGVVGVVVIAAPLWFLIIRRRRPSAGSAPGQQ